jgi:hypothetical protein
LTPTPSVLYGAENPGTTAASLAERPTVRGGLTSPRPLTFVPDGHSVVSPRARLWVAATIAATLLGAGAGIALNVAPLQAITVSVFLLVQVGAAPLLLFRRMSVMWFALLSVSISLTTTMAVGFVMSTTYFWSPATAFAIVVAVTVAMLAFSVVRDARILAAEARDRSTVRPRSFDPARLRVSQLIAAGTAAGLLVVALSSAAAAGTPQPGGLFLSVGPVWYLGLAAIIGCAVWAKSSGTSAAIPVLALSGVTVFSQAIAYGTPTVMSAARHVGIVDYIRDNGGVSPWLDIYQAWSGLFAGVAWLCDVANITDAMIVATWWPVLISPVTALAVAVLASRWLTGRFRIWFAAAVFALTNSLNTTYFSPQSLGLLIALVIFAIIIVPRGRPERSPFVASWPRAVIVQRLGYWFRSRLQPIGIARLTVILYLSCVLAVTHQISPYLATAALFVLVVFGFVRPWWVPFVVLTPAVVWAVFNAGVLDQFVSWSAIGQFGRNIAPPEHEYTQLPTPAVTDLAFSVPAAALVVVGIVALIAAIQHHNRVAFCLLFVAASPGSLFAATDYGQEGIFRVVLFAVPWLAIIAAGVRWKWTQLTTPVAALSLATMLAVSVYGLTALDWNRVVRSDAAEATKIFEDVAPDGATLLIMGSGNATPGGITGHYLQVSYVSREAFGDYPEPDQPYDPQRDVEQLTSAFAGWDAAGYYALVSESTGAYGERYGFQTNEDFEYLAEAMAASPLWDPIFEGPTTTLYQLSDVAVRLQNQ